MSKNNSFEGRVWNDSLDLPIYLRRGLSGIYLLHQYPGEARATPTCIEDCSDGKIRGWLFRDGDVEMALNTLNHLQECLDALIKSLHEDERAMVIEAIEQRSDKPELDKEPVLFDVVDAVVWYCHMITLTADIFGVCSPDTEAEVAYNERTERRKLQNHE